MQPIMTLRNKGEVRWEWIGDAWKLFADNPGAWIAMMLISLVILVIAVILPTVFLVPFGIFASVDQSPAGFFALAGSALAAIVMIGIISFLVTSYLAAGLYRAAIRQARGEAISPSDLFSASDSFPGVLGIIGLITLADIILIGIFFVMTVISEELGALFSLFRLVFRLVAMGFLFYSIPLIVDRRAGVIEAIKTSISATLSQWWMYVIFAFVLAVIIMIGALLCGLGLFVAFPLFFLASAAAYRDTFLMQDAQNYDRYATPPPPPSYQTMPAPPNYLNIPPRPQFSNPPQPQSSNPPQPQFSNPPEPTSLHSQETHLIGRPPEPTSLHSQETHLIGRPCPACGATITRVANFCNQCGSQLPSS